MEYSKLQDKCRGSLVGGAVGDALGYEVEFMSLSAIRKRFGEKGITRYVLHDGVAEFSDDTQMTLFTLEGLMKGIIDTKAGKPEDILPYIKAAYLNWYRTQAETPKPQENSWMSYIRALWARRAPGMTCMGALENIANGFDVDNNSKGCGGVMRVAPIGIFNAAHSHIYSYEDTAHLAGWAAELTHKHIASTFASATLAMIVANCIHDEKIDQMVFSWIVDGSVTILRNYIPGNDEAWLDFRNLIHKAMDLGKSDVSETDAIRQLGEGWVGDEALAIAVFSVMRHVDSFEDCIICAVNHDGDSDSTGAIAGNIIGAIHGYSAIPDYYLKDLEIEPILVSAADDLCADVKIPEVTQRIGGRYVKHLSVEVEEKYLL